MGRHKRFARDEVLDHAVRAFWRHGYGGTSIQDLVDATGVNRASLYATFGDKERVFLAALDQYVARVSAGWLDVLRSSDSARDGMRRYFEALIAFALGEGRGPVKGWLSRRDRPHRRLPARRRGWQAAVARRT